ncbi:hypothetical protein BOX15_Mlig005310g1 [Macrostomum lignano]|uniref:PDZ domain-containing protein n=1 Tax=Macrostomum lignano TaxID=282301 RepID=A0A267F9D3_9PLAT|nr:hypothetical protein BOX15_Mlig005310g1 [Macrostomum lignano]
MSTANESVKWQDLLEKEFDKSFADLELLLHKNLSSNKELYTNITNYLNTICSTFSQLNQRALTIFYNNAKLEAQLVSMRTDLASAQAAAASSAGAASAKASSSLADVDAQPPQPASSDSAKSEILKFERDIVVNENAELRRYCLALQTELYAARLTAKYLNKELAGRVQQMQLLTASSNGTGLDGVSGAGSGGSGGGRHPMGPGERRRLWSQLEAEIRLHRCKTLLRASRGRSVARFLPNNGLAPGQEESLTDCSPRQVSVSKDPGEGLGVSIVGGREHGAPILISELHPGLPAARCGLIRVGDAILSVDGVSLREARHHDAVQVLSHLRESTVELTLVFVADVDQPGSADDDEVTDEDEDDRFVDLATGYRFRMYDDEMTTCHGNQLRKKLKNKTEVKLQPSCSTQEGKVSAQAGCANSANDDRYFSAPDSLDKLG